MLIDAPGVEETDDKSKGDDTEIALTDDNAEEVMNYINQLAR